jgi:ribosomal protein S18 acetylase RimI-like enzyme
MFYREFRSFTTAATTARNRHVPRVIVAVRDIMEPYRIRQATVEDLEPILEMMVLFNAFERIPWTTSAGREPLRTLLADASLGLVGFVEGGATPVGYFVVTWNYDLEWNGRDAFLTELFVVEQARGHGVGRAALAEAEKLAKRNGANALHLVVRPENERAFDLYKRSGFSVSPRVFLTKVLSGTNPSP